METLNSLPVTESLVNHTISRATSSGHAFSRMIRKNFNTEKCTGSVNGCGGKKCGRWNPRIEQVNILSDLFKCGLRTPTADQIRKICNHLSNYGNIENKNVFYWFQNHKARERHKRRPKVMLNNKLLPSTKYFSEVNKVFSCVREIRTLELFPMNSFRESDSQRLRLISNESKVINHPPLDLRLSFL